MPYEIGMRKKRHENELRWEWKLLSNEEEKYFFRGESIEQKKRSKNCCVGLEIVIKGYGLSLLLGKNGTIKTFSAADELP